jgi:hypothetical protein
LEQAVKQFVFPQRALKSGFSHKNSNEIHQFTNLLICQAFFQGGSAGFGWVVSFGVVLLVFGWVSVLMVRALNKLFIEMKSIVQIHNS